MFDTFELSSISRFNLIKYCENFEYNNYVRYKFDSIKYVKHIKIINIYKIIYKITYNDI